MWIKGIFKIVSLLIIFFLVLELLARMEDKVRWQAPLFQNYSWENLFTVDDLGRHGRPYGRFEKWQLNNLGFRSDQNISSKKENDVIRIVVLGASETFGLYESPQKDFVSQLQEELNSSKPRRYEVINVSCVGISLVRMSDYYEKFVRGLNPDIVLIYPSPAFYLDEEEPSLSQTKASNQKFEFRVMGKIKRQVKKFIPQKIQYWMRQLTLKKMLVAKPKDWQWTKVPEERVDLYKKHLEFFIHQTLKDQKNIFILTHANRFSGELSQDDQFQLSAWQTFYPRALTGVLMDMEQRANEVIRQEANFQNVFVMDAANQLTDDKYFADFVHWTDQGAKRLADYATQEILKVK